MTFKIGDWVVIGCGDFIPMDCFMPSTYEGMVAQIIEGPFGEKEDHYQYWGIYIYGKIQYGKPPMTKVPEKQLIKITEEEAIRNWDYLKYNNFEKCKHKLGDE